MIAKSNASEIILDWKGLKGNKERISLLCEQTSLKISRVQQLLKK